RGDPAVARGAEDPLEAPAGAQRARPAAGHRAAADQAARDAVERRVPPAGPEDDPGAARAARRLTERWGTGLFRVPPAFWQTDPLAHRFTHAPRATRRPVRRTP